MKRTIRRVGVIGAGVMGSGIAAHLANAGLEVLLLDIPSGPGPGPGERNAIAQAGLDKALRAKPAAFFHKAGARLVTVGNTEDDLAALSGCDLVIEAILERLDLKQALFAKLEGLLSADTVVASNTSGLRIADMVKGRGESFRKRFLVMHFFNPVRYMKLLELVPGTDTDPAVLERISRFGEEVLGKGIVVGKDTPNFVGNRIGVHGMMTTVHAMLEEGLSPEDVDAITGTPMGRPKSASFRTADMVGLDTFIHVADNCYASLPSDEEREIFRVPDFIRQMAERKLLGDKTQGGFYRKEKDGSIRTFDPRSLEYRAKQGDEQIKSVTKSVARLESAAERLKKLVADPGKAGAFAWKLLARSLAYSARRIGEITDSVAAIDDAMRWGYSWELGPFEIWDALGFAETTDRMVKDGLALPESIRKMRAAGVSRFYREDAAVFDLRTQSYTSGRRIEVLRRTGAPVLKNAGAEAWDLGDGILGLTFRTKANSIDPDVISMLGRAAEKAEEDFRGLLITNEGEHFCVGANLFLVVMAANQKQWEQIRQMVKGYQAATQRLKYARVPVVAAPYGMTLGGGLELCFACDAVQAAAETYAGLVEVGVGLIPGGAGTMNMLWRALEGIPDGTTVNVQEYVAQVFKNIALARVATSAEEAKAFGYFRKSDGVSFDRARQLAHAKALAVGLANSGYHPPAPRAHVLPGESGIATLRMMIDTMKAGGYASEHDAKIAGKLAVVLSGGAGGAAREVTEEEILELECEAFVSLCGEPKSLERMQYMLMNNKPLRN